MRLGQLARKLNIRPADVLAALPPGSVQPESNSNTRLSDDQVREVVQFFVPDNWRVISSEFLNEDVAEEAEDQVNEIAPQHDKVSTSPEPIVAEPGQQEEKPELIKASKIELPGLKVVGKIELPEKKEKDVFPPDAGETPQPAEDREDHRKKNVRRQDSHRHTKNPIALAREREQRETEKKKKAEAELAKQKRTKKYQEKVAGYKPVKVTRSQVKPEAQSAPAEAHVPSSTWGKFKRWLFRE
jgi:translation initiation factor IF-2